MHKNKKSVDLRRYSISPKSAFPPLTTHSQLRPEKLNPIPPFSVYSSTTDPNQTNYSKFFTAKPHEFSNSPYTDISTCRTVITSQDHYKSYNSNSEIIERIESYELRCKKGSSLESYLCNYNMLEKYFQETLSSLEDTKPTLKNGLVLFCRHFSDLAKQTLKLFKCSLNESQDRFEKLSLELTRIEKENKTVKQELAKLKNHKKIELEKIEKEIEEIFGKNDLEIQALRQGLNSSLGPFNQDTVDLLLEIWKNMDQEHEIPDINNSDFLGMDPSEIPDIMNKKFSTVHRFTVKRIVNMLNMKKITNDRETQTLLEYIPPALYSEQTKKIEKLQIQLNTAIMTVEKYRENLGPKVNTFELLETEKKNLNEEVQKLKKNTEALSSALQKSSHELTYIKSELESAKKEKESILKEKSSILKEKSSLCSKVAEQEKAILEAKLLTEKQEKTLKENEEKIQKLEKNLTVRNAVKETPEPVSPTQKKSLKFDEKELISGFKFNKRSQNPSSPTPSPLVNIPKDPSSITGDSSRLSAQGGQNTLISSSNPSSKGPENNKKKRGLNVKINKIDEISSPEKLKKNTDKYLNISVSSQKKDKKGAGIIQDDPNDLHNERLKNSRQGSKDYSDSQDSCEDSNEDLGISNNGTAVYVKRSGNSRHSQVSEFSRGSKESRGLDKRTAVSSKMTSMDDLIWDNCFKFSVGIQMNGFGMPDEESEENSGVYIFPFNPNQFYALRGDKYYHTSNCVFSAQPVLPELKSSIVFNSPYKLEQKD